MTTEASALLLPSEVSCICNESVVDAFAFILLRVVSDACTIADCVATMADCCDTEADCAATADDSCEIVILMLLERLVLNDVSWLSVYCLAAVELVDPVAAMATLVES